jgi:ATP/maltotriose-dependent transcriptional regulator MalT
MLASAYIQKGVLCCMTQGESALNKITIPLIKGVVPRERLFRQIDEILSRPVLWVTAPGGSGKTTLIANYLATRNLPSLWYQVDQGDADVATFFYFMGLAARKSTPRNRKPLPLLTKGTLRGRGR